LPLGLAEGHGLDPAPELGEGLPVLQDAPEVRQVAVEVVDDLGDSFKRLGKQDSQAAGVGLDVVRVAGHQGDDGRAR
jgi:hypothetical protein